MDLVNPSEICSGLEDKFKKVFFYHSTNTSTGTILPPLNGEIILTEFEGNVSALVSETDSSGTPTLEAPRDINGDVITITNFLASGGYNLSAEPVSTVAIIFAYKILNKDFNYLESIASIQIKLTAEEIESRYESLPKNTAFNKNFGTTADTVTEGNDSRLSDERVPVDNSVTNAKLADVPGDTLKGRVGPTSGDPGDLTASTVRSVLNVEDGATADQTPLEIKTAYESNTNTNEFDDAEKLKLGLISATTPADLDQMQTDLAALANGMTYRGEWDASTGLFPSGANLGYFYTVSVGGTVDGVSFEADDRLIAIVDNASTTTFAGNWTKTDATDAVQSVNGKVGNVVINKVDVGLGNVDNTSDLNKPISTATQLALDNKEDAFTKNTAFNKNFGTSSGTVTEGDDTRLSDERVPVDNSVSTVKIQDNSVTNTKLADMANGTFKARSTAGAGDPEDINNIAAKAILDYQADEVTVDSTGFNEFLSPADDDLQKVAQKLDDLGVEIILESSGLTILVGSIISPKITQVINFPTTGDYLVNISYLWNLDATNDDIYTQATIDGTFLGSVADGNGDIFIHREEPSDSTGGVDEIPGTGSNQSLHYNKTFNYTAATTGNKTFILQFGTPGGGVTCSMWDLFIRIIKQRA